MQVRPLPRELVAMAAIYLRFESECDHVRDG
nr:MAG TPA: hypothetical protein [Caudoviricetes sp.]